MKKTSVLALATVFLLASVCFAGERNMIRNFDKNGLKDLNNQLKKQEKLIKKLQKQLGQSGASTTTVQSTEDFVSETVLDSAGTVINTVPAVGVAREDGRLELYDTSIDEATVISIEPSSYVHETQAKIAVPSSYFLDLRGIYVDSDDQRYTADVAVLHDIDGNTITLANLDETNNVGTAGPIAGGRDQSGAFDASSWIHFFFIYNPVTGDVSSLSSASPTAPTLPTGYTFFVRCGAVYFKDTSVLTQSAQLGDTVYVNAVGLWNGAPSVANTYQTLDLSGAIPPTAKKIVGRFGFSSTTPSTDQAMFLSADSTTAVCYTWGNLSKDALYKDNLGDAQFFTMPILTSQTIWWTADSTDAWYGITIREFQDDL